MKTEKTLVFVFLICLTLSSVEPVDEIPDFEFDDAYRLSANKRNHPKYSLEDFDEFFIDDNDDAEFDIVQKEKNIHRTLFKALAAKELKYKFSEVLPLLRNLNKQQRMVFASIISAQLSSKGKRLTLDEVKLKIFGNLSKSIKFLI
jgi:hypothetical protein